MQRREIYLNTEQIVINEIRMEDFLHLLEVERNKSYEQGRKDALKDDWITEQEARRMLSKYPDKLLR